MTLMVPVGGAVVDEPARPAPLSEEDLRRLLVETTIAELRKKPFWEVSLESVAAASGVRRGEITRHFPDWASLAEASVDEWFARRTVPLVPIAHRAGAVAMLRAFVVASAADPALARVLLGLVDVAAAPDQPLGRWARTSYEVFYVLVEDALRADIVDGREPSTMDPAFGAQQLLALYDGLQIQALVRPSVDLVSCWDRAVTRMRRGWAAEYQQVDPAFVVPDLP